jgi:flagellar basal body P-ring protein FlgI
VTAVGGGLAVSCTHAPPQKAGPRYATLPLKKVPPFMAGTIFERADVVSTQPFQVSSYALVARLRDTGDSAGVPTTVREWMVNQMVKHGIGMSTQGLHDVQPEQLLNSPKFAIVRTDGYIPVGARRDQTFDVLVSALPDSTTSSLAHGVLYETDLGPNGANPTNPTVINVAAKATGPVFVNPAYSVQNDTKTDGAANSLRYGVVMDGGVVKSDWPIVLRLRQPQMALARAMDTRINQRFQALADRKRQNDRGFCVAEAQDEGTVYLYVPHSFHGDWEHLVGVVTHLYADGSPENTVLKAKQLADEAQKPDAPLLDISYAWEGLGEKALPYVQPLMTSEKQDVAYAAARAAAFLGDPSAVEVLIRMAGTRDHAFQLNATETLGKLPQTQQITHALRKLLDTDAALVRIEAYRILARERDILISTHVIDEKFVLDIVPSSGPPMIYATRQGVPRVAVIGNRTSIQTPLTFTAMQNQLSITSDGSRPVLKIFYRGKEVPQPTTVLSHPDVAELIARLGGEPHDVKDRLNFSYGDILGILQALADSGKFYATSPGGQTAVASFVLQDISGTQNEIVDTKTAATSTDGALPDLVMKEQDKRPLNNGAAGGARPQ